MYMLEPEVAKTLQASWYCLLSVMACVESSLLNYPNVDGYILEINPTNCNKVVKKILSLS